MIQGSIIRTPTETRESRFNSTLSPGAGHDKEVHGQQTKVQHRQPYPRAGLARQEEQQQAQRRGSGLRPGADVKEKHQVGKQQQIELGARVHAEGHATIPAFSKCFFSIFWPKKPPTRAQIKIASMLTTKLPLLMGANSVSM